MDLRLLRSFLEVAETRNFTRAATRIHIAQSALSQQISQLERDLGVRLFHRNSRSVMLTEAGLALVPLARDLLGRAERIRTEMDALAGLERGTLHIGLLQTPAPAIDVVDLVGAFHDAHPGIELHVTDAPSERMIASVEAGELDVAVVGLARAEVPVELDYIPLAVEPLVVVAAAGGTLDGSGPVALTDVVTAGSFVHFTAGSGIRRRVEAAFARAGVAPDRGFDLSQIPDMLRLAVRGLGVTVVPLAAVDEWLPTDGPDVVVRPLADAEAVHPTGLVSAPGRHSAAAAAFIELVENRLEGNDQGVRSQRARRDVGPGAPDAE